MLEHRRWVFAEGDAGRLLGRREEGEDRGLRGRVILVMLGPGLRIGICGVVRFVCGFDGGVFVRLYSRRSIAQTAIYPLLSICL